MFDLTKEQVLQTLKNYEKIMDRVADIVEEIGFIDTEFEDVYKRQQQLLRLS